MDNETITAVISEDGALVLLQDGEVIELPWFLTPQAY